MRELTEKQAIKKMREAQLLLRDVYDRTQTVYFQEVAEVVMSIQEIKDRLFNNVTK